MTFELLWTDKCFLVLLTLSFVVILLSLRKQPIRRACSNMLRRPTAISAGIVLLFFLFIGVLDSIRFVTESQASEPPRSLLDRILAPLDRTWEKTYSAPLALTQFVSETELVDGLMNQVFPRLVYPRKQVQNETQKTGLIEKTVWQSGSVALLVLFFSGLVLMFLRGFLGLKPWYGLNHPALVSTLLTLGGLSFLTLLGYQLSRTFHVFGTGQIGQDIFYLTIKSIHTGLVIGLLTTLFMMPLALFCGIAAGYFGGVIDDIIQYIYTTLSSIPGVLLITASVLSLQTYIANHPQQFPTLAQSADARLLALCFILGVTSWTNLCRLLRAETMKLRETDYISAARALGSGWFTILRKHILPNVMHIVVITLVLDFSFLVMAEAVLSYIGVGVSPMTISWGNMINSARLELARNPVIWWPILAAFVFMFLLVLAINLFADAVRDAFDPHQSES